MVADVPKGWESLSSFVLLDPSLPYKVREYETEAEAWQHPAQIVLSGTDVALYKSPKEEPKKTHFIIIPEDVSTGKQAELLGHELAHEEFRHSSPSGSGPDYYGKNEVEAILRGRQRWGRWFEDEAKYFRQCLGHLGSDDHRLLITRYAIDRLNYKGKVPWIYTAPDNTRVNTWIDSATLADDEAFDKWLSKREARWMQLRPSRTYVFIVSVVVVGLKILVVYRQRGIGYLHHTVTIRYRL